MHVLIIAYGGLTEDRKAAFREFGNQGIRLSVVVPKKIPADKTYSASGFLEYNAGAQEPGFQYIPIGLVAPGFIDAFKFFPLLRAVQSANPDVVLVLNEYTSSHVTEAILCRNILGKRKSMKIVAYTFENIPFAPGNFLRRLMLRYHAKNVDGVTSCNQAGVDNLQAADARFPTQRIFRGVELSLFAAQDKTESRKKLGIPQDAKVMGYVGRIIPEKGLDDILSALALLPDYFSVMVGNGTYQPALEKRARELGISDRVKWFPGVAASQLAAYYSSFDVCVLASHTTNTWKEQYGMVLVEAMACKLGVVGSSSGAIPEVLRGYPKGAIFPEGDAQALVAAVRKVESLQLPPSFDLPGFLDQFSNRNFAAAHIAFFKQLLNHG